MKIQEIGDIKIVITDERLDAVDGPTFKDVIKELSREFGVKLILDMKNTLFFDSAACGILISCLRTVTNNDGEMRITRPCSQCLEVLKLTRLHRVFDIHDSLESAIRSFTPLTSKMPG